MLQLLYTFCLFFAITYRYLRHKPTLGLLVIYSLYCPRIAIGSLNVNSIFLFVVLLVGLQILKGKIVFKRKQDVWVKKFTGLMVFELAVFLFSWVVMSRIDFGATVTVILGLAKNLLLLLLIYGMNSNFERKEIEAEFAFAVVVMLLANTFASLIQLVSVPLGKALVMFRNDPLTNQFMAEVIQYGTFARCFGLMSYPMMLGIFSVMSIAFFVFMKQETPLIKYIGIGASLICTVLSASKTALLGTGFVLVLYVVLFVYFGKQPRKSALILSCFGICILLMNVFYHQIGSLIERFLGPSYAYYWGILANISEAFATRYSADEATVLAYMPAFLEKYWLLGVGPSSIAGEKAIDSAFYAILHHGGIVALIPVVYFYIRLIYRCWKKREILCFVFLISMVIMGTGFQTWLCVEINIWILAYVFLILKLREPQKTKLLRNA